MPPVYKLTGFYPPEGRYEDAACWSQSHAEIEVPVATNGLYQLRLLAWNASPLDMQVITIAVGEETSDIQLKRKPSWMNQAAFV